MDDLFLFGDPRVLAGGVGVRGGVSCDLPAPLAPEGATPLTEEAARRYAEARGGSFADPDLPRAAARAFGLAVYSGRDSYHGGRYRRGRAEGAAANVYAGPDDLPTVGVEIETYLRDGVSRDAAERSLWSTWFRFEEDGSLDRARGYELITEVLPPRVYRDVRTWTALQNLLNPYLESYGHPDTGLHVHVGTACFEGCDALPSSDPDTRRRMGAAMAAFAYHGLLSPGLLDKVYLRAGHGYCAEGAAPAVSELGRRAARGTLYAGDALCRLLFCGDGSPYASYDRAATGALAYAAGSSRADPAGLTWSGLPAAVYAGHRVELNLSHSYTMEFRRGKGTLNALSVHRMVELAATVVRYAWKACREPDMVVSPRGLYRYVADNTASASLRTLVGAELERLDGTAKAGGSGGR